MFGLSGRHTGQTLLWFGLLAVLWEVAPVSDQWKVLPDVADTFLVRGFLIEGAAPPPQFQAAPVIEPAVEKEASRTASPSVLNVPGNSWTSQPVWQDGQRESSLLFAEPPSSCDLSSSHTDWDEAWNQESWVMKGGGPTESAPLGLLTAVPSLPATLPASRTIRNSGRRQGSSLIAPLVSPLVLEEGCLRLDGEGKCLRTALEPFYEALERTDRREPGAVVRITHYGDSIIASDYISASVRVRLQKRWGDAGHGFVLAGKPWRWYHHRGVEHSVSGGWVMHAATTKSEDRRFGLGGVRFECDEVDCAAEFGTTHQGRLGRSVSRFELYYHGQPGGGSLELTVDGQFRQRLSTDADEPQAAFLRIPVPDGAARLGIRTLGDGPVRLYGVTLERSTPGVVYDSVGLVGGSIWALRRNLPSHWVKQLARRRSNLIIFTFGANEIATFADAKPVVLKQYERSLGRIIRLLRRALPNVSVLVTGPLDSAEKVDGVLVTRPVIHRLAQAQRAAALKNGAAYWDTFTVMGGEGSMARWVAARLGASDLIHPSWAAADFLGKELARSLIAGYEGYHAGERQSVVLEPLAPLPIHTMSSAVFVSTGTPAISNGGGAGRRSVEHAAMRVINP